MLPEDVKSQADQYLIPENFYAVRRLRCSLRLESPDGHTYFVVPPSFESNIFNSIYLPGLRGKPERTGPLASTDPPYPGPFQHYAASIIHKWQETRDERLEALADALYTLGLTGRSAQKKSMTPALKFKSVSFLTAELAKRTWSASPMWDSVCPKSCPF